MIEPDTLTDVRCKCPCHEGSIADRWRGGVDSADVIEAAASCARCRNRHCPALLSKRCANDPVPVPRATQEPWVDAVPVKTDEGEGAE